MINYERVTELYWEFKRKIETGEIKDIPGYSTRILDYIYDKAFEDGRKAQRKRRK